MLPGAPLDYSPPGRPYPQERIESTLTDAENTVAEFTERMQTALSETLQPVLDVATELQSALEGGMENTLQPIEATIGNLADKSFERVVSRLDQIYSIIIPMGYDPPQAGDVVLPTFPEKPGPQPPQPPQPPPSDKPPPPIFEPRPPISPPVRPGGDETGEGEGEGVDCPMVTEPCGCIMGMFPPQHAPPTYDYAQQYDTLIGTPFGVPLLDGTTPAGFDCYHLSQEWFFLPVPGGGPGTIPYSATIAVPSEWWVLLLDIGDGQHSNAYTAPIPLPGFRCLDKSLRVPCPNQSGEPPTLPPTTPPPPPPQCPPPPPPPIEQCPAVPAFDCGAPPPPEIKPLSKCTTEDYCDSMAGFVESGLPNNEAFLDFIGMGSGKESGGTISKAIRGALLGADTPILPSIVNRFREFLRKCIRAGVKATCCEHVALLTIAMWHGAMKFLDGWFKVIPRAALNTAQQLENLTCQTGTPGQAAIDAAYLGDKIKLDRWECYTKLEGNVVPIHKSAMETKRIRPDAANLSRLLRRKQLKEAEWKERMRAAGVIDDKDRQAIFDLTQEWPSASDLLPWMVRDVWDETTIDWTEVDKLFESKWTEDAKDKFEAIGWTKEQAKLHWRAHFHLPSFTMASEMYHRYRNLPDGHPLKTDLKKVKALLVQDDWHPDWLERMLAITFRPMRLVDIRNAYDMRVIDDETLREKLQISGYSDDDVDTTLRFWKRRRELRDARQGGLPTVSQLVKQYANCELDHGTFSLILPHIVETQEQEQWAFEAAELARTTEDSRRTIAGVSYQYRRGLITEAEAHEHLARGGIDPSCIPSLVKVWKERFAKQPKQLTAGVLCTMLERGIITSGEYVSALMRAGWTPQDAQRLLANCQIGLTVKEMRRARAEADRLARDQKRLEREAAKAARLEECGPAPCPANRQTANRNGTAGP